MAAGTWNRISLQSVDEIISKIIDTFAIENCKIAFAIFFPTLYLQELDNPSGRTSQRGLLRL
jgi:hypothetical protein